MKELSMSTALCGLCGQSLANEPDIRDITIRGEQMKAHCKCASDRLTELFIAGSKFLAEQMTNDEAIDIEPERLRI